jgi:hypothetical protein
MEREVARHRESHAKNIHMRRGRMMKRYATKQGKDEGDRGWKN